LIESIREHGLRLRINQEEKIVENPVVVGSIEEALTRGPFDVAILAIKAYDTPAFVESIIPYAVALPPILCLQNGVENEKLLSKALGNEKVISGTVTSAVGRRGPGDIILEKLRGMGVSGEHFLASTLTGVLNAAGLRARLYRKPEAMKWSKLLTNLLANASSAILDFTPAQIFSDAGLYQLECRQIKETLAVMKALRYPVVDLPGTPVKAMAWSMSQIPSWASQPVLKNLLGSGRGAKMPSFHIDLYSGKPLNEVEYLNGAVVRFGDHLGVPTPVNQVYTRILLSMVRGEIKREEFAHQPEKLIRLFSDNK
jgi:2-dehydropantoate 2-reductase